MAVFEFGKEYRANGSGLDVVRVLKRTRKMILVENSGYMWRMLIRIDKNGDEYAIDSSAGKAWADDFTYQAKMEVKQ